MILLAYPDKSFTKISTEGKKAIIFVDANNWYHNVKKWFKPSEIDISKNPNYTKEDFEEFIIKMIQRKKDIIEGAIRLK